MLESKSKEMNIKKEVNFDNCLINDLFDFSSNDKDKIKASEILKIVNEKSKLSMNSSQIKKKFDINWI
jgi:hypothetical protein